jgi:spore coat protein CotF
MNQQQTNQNQGYGQVNYPKSTHAVTTQNGQPVVNYGAHEVLEVSEILRMAIDSIHVGQMFRPLVKDQQLTQIIDRQLQFMVQEYNGMVNMLNHRGMQQAIPYRTPLNVTPQYGLNQPPKEQPVGSPQQMNDGDVGSVLLGSMKSSASMKMMASLECADPEIRRALAQSSVNCNEMAYEIWNFMNQKGYYQVPTMKDTTAYDYLNSFEASNTGVNGVTNIATGYSQYQ